MKHIPDRLIDYIMYGHESIYKAYYKLTKELVRRPYKIILVINDDESLFGIVTAGDFNKLNPGAPGDSDVTVKDVANTKFSFLKAESDVYAEGQKFFSRAIFNEIPVIDENNVPTDILGRFQILQGSGTPTKTLNETQPYNQETSELYAALFSEARQSIVNNKIVCYTDLQDKELILWGEEKIRADVYDFWGSDRDIKIVASLDTVCKELNWKEGQIVVICSFETEPYVTQLLNAGFERNGDFITLDDLVELCDEIELYNNALNHKGKKIVLLGAIDLVLKLVQENPHLNVAYIVDLKNTCGKLLGCDIRPLSELLKEKSGAIRIICAIPPNMEIRNFLKQNGFIFGADFYFADYRDFHLLYPSVLLKQTIKAAPKYNLSCGIERKPLQLYAMATSPCCSNIKHCNWRSLAFNNLQNIITDVYSRILYLSFANRSYCFCSTINCDEIENPLFILNDTDKGEPRNKYNIPSISKLFVELAYDNTCNLACVSCRKRKISTPENMTISRMVHESILETLPQFDKLQNTAGELFASKYYREIFLDKKLGKKINILTNGTLFTEHNMKIIQEKYDEITTLSVSIDAATKATYAKVRGGDFDKLMKNLRMLAQCRKSGFIKYFSISFVISQINFREMSQFIEMGRSLGVDKVSFFRLQNWGTFTSRDFIDMDVYDKSNPCHNEFIEQMENPIFKATDVSMGWRDIECMPD